MNDTRKKVEAYVLKNATSIIGESMNLTDMQHVVDISLSIVHTRDKSGPTGGSFVKAIVENDLERAVSYADSVCMRAIKLFVMVKLWFHPENE